MKELCLTLLAVGLAFGCAVDAPTSADPVAANLAVAGSSENPGDGIVTIPFKAKFFTEEVSLVLDDCGPGIALNTQEGMGNATHLGQLTTRMVFCFNLNPGPDFGAYDFKPGSENGHFVAANGDELWISVTGGQVIFDPNLGPKYAAYFQDPFVFLGGTGRFEGATGGGQINSLVRADLIRTDHEWTGELTLSPGR